jgi:hypothetical protein|tara:strand:- start:379 stop:801 length:423 start_codon:yes stop_codon:yes gene_type:complete
MKNWLKLILGTFIGVFLGVIIFIFMITFFSYDNSNSNIAGAVVLEERPDLELDISTDSDWSLSQGYYVIITGDVINYGGGSAYNTEVTCRVLKEDSTTVGSGTINLGTISEKSKGDFETTIDFTGDEAESIQCLISCDNC